MTSHFGQRVGVRALTPTYGVMARTELGVVRPPHGRVKQKRGMRRKPRLRSQLMDVVTIIATKSSTTL